LLTKCRRLAIVFLIMALALIPGAYGTIIGGGGTSVSSNSAGSSAGGNFEASNTGFASLASSKGLVTFDDTRFVDDGTHHVDIKLEVDNGRVNKYSTSYKPKKGNILPTNKVGIIDTLDITNADLIKVQTNARIGPIATPSSSSSIEIQVDRAGSIGAAFKGTTEANAGTNTQATLKGHVEGALKSTGTAYDGTITANEQGDSLGAPIKADLNLKAMTGSTSVRGAGIFYVDTSWNGKIQDAVNAAWDGDTIKVSPGTYTENVKIDKSLAVNGAGACKTIVNGDTDGDSVGDGSVFTILPNVDVSLSDMTITNGKANYGGGIFNDPPPLKVGSTLTLNKVLITRNTALYGGGFFNDHGTITKQLTVAEFTTQKAR
jgi:hypothetical protein